MWVAATRPASISRALSQPYSVAMSPKSPKLTLLPRVATPFMVPRCVLRNLTRFGINMESRLLRSGLSGREDRRARAGRGARGRARVELLALVDPHLDADGSLRGDRGGDREVDHAAQGVQRDAAEVDVFAPRDFRAAEAALDLDLHALGAQVHDHFRVAAHRAAVGSA